MRFAVAIASLVAVAMAATMPSGLNHHTDTSQMKEQLQSMQTSIDTKHCGVAKAQVLIMLELFAERAHRGQVQGEKKDVMYITLSEGREVTEKLQHAKKQGMKDNDGKSQHNVRGFGRKKKFRKGGKKGGKKGDKDDKKKGGHHGHGHNVGRDVDDGTEEPETHECECPACGGCANSYLGLGDEVSLMRLSCSKARGMLEIIHDTIPDIHIGQAISVQDKGAQVVHDGEHVFYLRHDEVDDLGRRLKKAAIHN